SPSGESINRLCFARSPAGRNSTRVGLRGRSQLRPNPPISRYPHSRVDARRPGAGPARGGIIGRRMDAPGSATLVGDFVGVLARIERDFEPIQIERVATDSIRIHRRGAELAVLAAGAELPAGFDVALIVGAGEELAHALAQL